jgi:hypothetical protein
MIRTGDANGGDGCAFDGAEEHPAEGIANGYAVSVFKRFGDELCIRIAA